MKELPEGWITTTIGEAFEVILGQSPPSSTYNEEGNGLPFFQGKAEFGNKYPEIRKWCSEPKKTAEKNDILISVRAPVGPTNINPTKSCIGRGLAAIRPYAGMSNLFILYLIRAFENDLKQQSTGSTFSAITGSRLKAISIPLPPINEQIRIVEKIEELFTRLDQGTKTLQETQQQLEYYEDSLLKSAFSGELTKKLRKNNPYDDASSLIDRIFKEMEKLPSQRYEPLEFNHSELPVIPNNWKWIQLGKVFYVNLGQSPPSSTYNEEELGLPFFQGSKEFGEKYPAVEKWCSKPNKIAEEGDTLISVRAPVGDVNIAPKKCCIGRGLAAIRPLAGLHYLFPYYLIKHIKKILESKGTGSTFNAITGNVLRNHPIPLPPLIEANNIVNFLEKQFSIIKNTKITVSNSVIECSNLKQSILSRAFSGGLVPQDSTDEPASLLLERVKAEKVKDKPQRKRRSKKKTKDESGFTLTPVSKDVLEKERK